MAKQIADRLDFERYGVKGVYLIGSTNTGTAGPGSDIDLLIHVQGSWSSARSWINGWPGGVRPWQKSIT